MENKDLNLDNLDENLRKKEAINSPEVQELVEAGMIKLFSSEHLSFGVSDALEIKNKFNASEEVMQEVVKTMMIKLLSNGDVSKALEIKTEFNISEEVTQEAAKTGMINFPSNANFFNPIKIKNEFNVSEEVINSPEVQEALKAGMIRLLYSDYASSASKALEIKTEFNISEEVINSPEVQEALKAGMIRLLSKFSSNYYNVSDPIKIKNEFNVSEEVMQEALKTVMIKLLSNGDVSDASKALEIKTEFNVSEEVINSPEVQEAVKTGMIRLLYSDYASNVIKIKNEFNVSEEVMQEALKAGMIRLLYSDYASSASKALEIKAEFNVSEEVMQEVVKASMINFLSEGDVSNALKIKNKFNASEEVINSPEVQETLKTIMIKLLSKERLSKSDVSDALEIKAEFNVSEEVMQEVVKASMINFLSKSDVSKALEIKTKFNISEEVINSPEVQEAAKTEMIKLLSKSNVFNTLKIKNEFNVSEEVINSPEVQEALKAGMIRLLYSDYASDASKALEIKTEFNVSEEVINSPEVQEAAKTVMIKFLSKGDVSKALKIKNEFNISEEVINSPEVQEAAKTVMIKFLSEGDVSKALEIKNEFNVSEEVTQEAAKTVMIKFLSEGDVSKALEIKTEFNISFQEIKKYILRNINNIILANSEEVKEFIETTILGPSWQYVNVASVTENIKLKLDLVKHNDLNVEDIDVHEIIFNPSTEDDYQKLFESTMLTESKEWSPDGGHEISDAFQKGAEYFGYKRMFEYVNTPSERHDKLFAFNHILNIAYKSKLDPQVFFNNILRQVSADTGLYDEQFSYQKLNTIAQTGNSLDISNVLEEAKKYENITKMKELLDVIPNESAVFSSWKMLRKFYDIVQLLDRTELLEDLEKISEEQKRLSNFIETLMFHPNIDTQSVVRFWKRPYEFLDIEEDHAPEAHELKKPSNYTDIPYMELDAFNLRDALVEGSLDSIQDWTALDVVYQLPVNENYRNISLGEQVQKALGSRRDGIPGEARDPGLLFKKLNDFAKSERLQLLDMLQNKVELTNQQMEEMSRLLYDEKFGFHPKSDEYRVKIGLKSDPDVLVAGNDTACCMPFGSGKNNVYMYNPVVGQLIVQKKNGDEWKTVAQSVMTKNKDIQTDISELINNIQNEGQRNFEKLVSEDVLRESQDIITCDNIEVSPNFKDIEALRILYNNFFSEYVERFGDTERLDTSRIIIGKGFSDALFGESIKNTFLPKAPLGYSDNVNSTAMEMKLGSSQSLAKKITVDAVQFVGREQVNDLGQGVAPLTYRDTLAVSYIEGKAYADNSSLKEYLHNLENGLIAKDIYNSHFNVPNMSFKYQDQEGKTQGYMFAYEGVEDDEKVLYIADLAANPQSKTAGGRLIKTFLDQYDENYLKKDNPIPILAQARDKTSYSIINNQLNKRSLKTKFRLEELDSYSQGEDIMHLVKIVPVP